MVISTALSLIPAPGVPNFHSPSPPADHTQVAPPTGLRLIAEDPPIVAIEFTISVSSTAVLTTFPIVCHPARIERPCSDHGGTFLLPGRRLRTSQWHCEHERSGQGDDFSEASGSNAVYVESNPGDRPIRKEIIRTRLSS